MNTPVKLIVGLGNPGTEYENTRHNAGALLLVTLASHYNCPLSPDKKFFGLLARIMVNSHDLRLLIPTTFMNRSGQAVAAVVDFYKIAAEEILIAHDELDIEPGTLRLKFGGGHGGHNGLRDIIQHLGGNKDFYRLRLGIGHPGDSRAVTNYVLGRGSKQEQDLLQSAVDEGLRYLPEILSGDHQQAMNHLHSFRAE